MEDSAKRLYENWNENFAAPFQDHLQHFSFV
jgi:hypothetical protein